MSKLWGLVVGLVWVAATATLVCCGQLARPVDLVRPGPIYCEPLHEDVLACRDAQMRMWRCEWVGRWTCEEM